MPLPDAILEAWPSDSLEKLGGWMEIAGVDAVEAFAARAIRDHPWLGLEVKFPFPEVGKGAITRCLTHPYRKLMFDVAFPEPVPPILNGQVVLNKVLYSALHRFFGHELKELAEAVQ
jgi:hypothetical protein